MFFPVILAGGHGTRLWPLSRENYPKQLLSLLHEETLLQKTVQRILPFSDLEPPLVLTNEAHRFAVASQLQDIHCEPSRILLEPLAKNTAPAIALAAFYARAISSEAILLVLPSDHLLSEENSFYEKLSLGKIESKKNKIVTFGISPSYPASEYGYIEQGEPLSPYCFKVKNFIEKPPEPLAKEFLKKGSYYWNSGIFIFKAQFYLEQLKEFSPLVFSTVEKTFQTALHETDFTHFQKAPFLECPSISIDYALLEKPVEKIMIPLQLSWKDIGSWNALYEASEKDPEQNVLRGDVHAMDVKNSYIQSTHRMVAAIGVSDHIIVETGDAVFIAHQQQSEKLKLLVNQLKNENRSEVMTHLYEYRPWGKYEILSQSNTFKVKLIYVSPKKSLSLQKHEHRSEHWVVVKGLARVTRGEEIILLKENQSTYIPTKVKHRLENPSEEETLCIIEVQCGDYLSEEDIIRYQDHYGRAPSVPLFADEETTDMCQ